MNIPHQVYKIDINNINEPQTRIIECATDSGVRFVDVELWADSVQVALPEGCTAIAIFVTDGILINDAVTCEISSDLTSVIVPIDNDVIQSKSGIMSVQVEITDAEQNVLALPYAFKVRVKKSILENAKITDESIGTVAEIMKEVAKARGDFANLAEALNYKLSDGDGTVKLANLAQEILDYIVAHSNGEGGGVTLTQVQTLLADYAKASELDNKEDISNRVTSFTQAFTDESDAKYPTVLALLKYLSDYYYDYSDIYAAFDGIRIDDGNLIVLLPDGEEKSLGSVKGEKGDTGANGSDYVLTDTDKTEIANIVINEYDSSIMAGTGSLIEIVDSVDEMADTSKKYVLSSTGNIWTFKDTTIIKEITEKIIGTTENPYLDGNRLSSDGSAVNDSAEMVLTPYIDISKYEKYGKIKLKLAGIQYIYPSHKTNVKLALYDDYKNKIICGESCIDGNYGYGGVIGFAIADDNSASVEITIPYTYAGKIVKYMRFNTIGTSEESDITITYKGEVTESQWCDTGVSYGVDNKTKDKISSLNNEGADPSSLTLLSQPVLDFYNSGDYPDYDYTITHLSKITYPCRADTPVPYTIKWAHNENAMRTTVAVDTKAIGAVNAYTMRTYDATGLDNYPIYNLLPNTTYYYKVTHILSDGSITEAKSGSFTTSAETIRLLNIDGTQNVRDLGGWTGLNGKKVKYGKLIRGASFSDSSFPSLILTGKGRLALAELKVQAELNLGATDTETSISSNCAYKKLYYTNYAIAITDSTARANFKILLEWIVSCLDGTLSVSGLETVTRNVYIHCQGGCDRTGTLCFLLLGLLGISESDLAKEYELSSFSDVGFGRLRTTKKAIDVYDYVGMIEALKQYSGTTITEKFVDFATTGCNISMEKINKFRELMLE